MQFLNEKDERINVFLLHPDSNVFISLYYLYELMAISFCNEHDIGGKSEQKRKALIYLVPEGRRVRHQTETSTASTLHVSLSAAERHVPL